MKTCGPSGTDLLSGEPAVEAAIPDGLPREVLDELTNLAATICEVSTAAITVLQKDWVRFCAQIGLKGDGVPRAGSFCDAALEHGDLFVVADLAKDDRFAQSPFVAEAPRLRFYAGMPLRGKDGRAFGTLCVMDAKPRTLTRAQEQTLRVLGRQVAMQFALASRHTRELSESQERSRTIVESALDAIVTIDHEEKIVDFNPAAERIFGWPRAEVVGRDMPELLIPAPHREGCRRGIARFLETGKSTVLGRRLELTALRHDGTEMPVELTVTRLGQEWPPHFTAFLRDLTERREAEEATREAARFKKATIDALSSHLCVLDEHGAILATNDAWEHFAAANPPFGDGVRGSNYLAVCDATPEGPEKEDAVAFAEGIRAVLRGEVQAFSREYPCHSATERRWFIGRVTRFRGEGPVRVVVSHENITERKEAEQRLVEAARFAQSTIDALSAHLCVLDEDCTILATNLAWRAFSQTGQVHDPDVFPGANYLKVCRVAAGRDARDAERFADGIRSVIRGEREEFQMEYECNSPTEQHWFEGRVTRFPGEGPLRLVVAHEDITKRKLAERAEAEMEERYRAIFRHAPDGMLIADPAGVCIDANPNLCAMLGYSREEIIGSKLADFVVSKAGDAFSDAVEAVRAGKPHSHEWHLQRRDGVLIPVEIIMTHKPNGNLLAMIRDVTERKKLEEQFLRAQRMESIGTLAGGIAHDLNNTLSPILMALNLLEMRFTDPASAELISLIRDSAHHGANMVKQVLSFSRGIEGQRIGLQLHHLVREVEKIANDTFLKNIQVRTRVAHDLWTVLGDPTHLHQVLMNLCVNARDAMPQGGVLTISAENMHVDEHYAALEIEARPGPYVVLRVEDTGAGMPPDVIEKIFDPFFTTKEVGKGTGLGLSTTLAIVKSHGGFIRVQSAPLQGTKFEIFLPAEPDHTAMTPEAADLGCPRGNGELVLVVDDEMAVRKITQQTLEAYGYRVILASDGAEAVGVFAKHIGEIAVVLTDMTMPLMSGATAIAILRKMKPELPIVATSGLDTHGQKSRAVELERLGVKFFLEKPFGADVLLRAIRDALSAHA